MTPASHIHKWPMECSHNFGASHSSVKTKMRHFIGMCVRVCMCVSAGVCVCEDSKDVRLKIMRCARLCTINQDVYTASKFQVVNV